MKSFLLMWPVICLKAAVRTFSIISFITCDCSSIRWKREQVHWGRKKRHLVQWQWYQVFSHPKQPWQTSSLQALADFIASPEVEKHLVFKIGTHCYQPWPEEAYLITMSGLTHWARAQAGSIWLNPGNKIVRDITSSNESFLCHSARVSIHCWH